MSRLTARLAAAAFLAAAAGLPLTATDARAADDCDGVRVVVDARAAGGSLTSRCAPGDPASGFQALEGAGHTTTFVPGIPGFVCTIDARPDPCNGAPADAYWSYWFAPAGGDWSYAASGAGSRDPAPGSVDGWRFGNGSAPPGMKPPSSQEPTAEPDAEPEPESAPAPDAEPDPTPMPEPTPADDGSPAVDSPEADADQAENRVAGAAGDAGSDGAGSDGNGTDDAGTDDSADGGDDVAGDDPDPSDPEPSDSDAGDTDDAGTDDTSGGVAAADGGDPTSAADDAAADREGDHARDSGGAPHADGGSGAPTGILIGGALLAIIGGLTWQRRRVGA